MSGAIDKRQVAASFSRAAGTYDSVAELQRSVGGQLLEQIAPDLPGPCLDLGCGTGYFTERLARAGQPVLGLDIAQGMLRFAREERGRKNIRWLCGDAEALPLASASQALVFSSLAIQWCENLDAVFSEVARVLRPGGRFYTTTLGPRTLCELREAWAAVDGLVHVNRFAPRSSVLQAALQGGLRQASLVTEPRVLRYASLRDLTGELKGLGAHNINAGRPAGLTGRAHMRAFMQAYEGFRDTEGWLPATYEVIYGCFEKPVGD